MLPVDLFLSLCAFAFVSSATPGPNNMMLMASGTNYGFARTIPHMMGVSIGFVFMVLLVGAGLAKVFLTFPAVYTGLKIGSILYLAYLSWKIATSTAVKTSGDGDKPSEKPMTFLQAALFQWINPKAWTMALMSVTAYVPAANPVSGLLIVALVFGLINQPVVAAWTFLGVQLRTLLDDPLKLRIFNVSAALILLASLYPVVMDLLGHRA